MQMGTNKDGIILIFASSSTTSNAVMDLNAQNGGNRKFILVQLPELCDEKAKLTRQAIRIYVTEKLNTFAALVHR